jgi:hypothetical protein
MAARSVFCHESQARIRMRNASDLQLCVVNTTSATQDVRFIAYNKNPDNNTHSYAISPSGTRPENHVSMEDMKPDKICAFSYPLISPSPSSKISTKQKQKKKTHKTHAATRPGPSHKR